jgi:hypothetical protein
LKTANAEFQVILHRRIGIARELRKILGQIIAHQIGTNWGHEQIETIISLFDKLRELDTEWQSAGNSFGQIVLNEQTEQLVKLFRQELLGVKESLAIYEARLAGAMSLVDCEIKQITNSKKIRGYGQGSVKRNIAAVQVC